MIIYQITRERLWIVSPGPTFTETISLAGRSPAVLLFSLSSLAGPNPIEQSGSVRLRGDGRGGRGSRDSWYYNITEMATGDRGGLDPFDGGLGAGGKRIGEQTSLPYPFALVALELFHQLQVLSLMTRQDDELRPLLHRPEVRSVPGVDLLSRSDLEVSLVIPLDSASHVSHRSLLESWGDNRYPPSCLVVSCSLPAPSPPAPRSSAPPR